MKANEGHYISNVTKRTVPKLTMGTVFCMNNCQAFLFYFPSFLHIAMPSNVYELLLWYIALLRVETNQHLHCCNVTSSFILGTLTCPEYFVTNGIVMYTQTGPPFPEGTIGMTTCNADLTLFGDVNRTCQGDGTWPGFTRCEYSITNHAVYWVW